MLHTDIGNWLQGVIEGCPVTEKRLRPLIPSGTTSTCDQDQGRFERTQVMNMDLGTAGPTFQPPYLPCSSAVSQSSADVYSSDTSTVQTDSSRKRDRSDAQRMPSPKKQKVLLRNLRYPVTDIAFGRIPDIPERLRPLGEHLRCISQGRALYCAAQAAALRPILSEVVDYQEQLADGSPIWSNTLQLGGIPTVGWAKRIVEETNLSIVLFRSEAAWNCHVHFPILQEARYLSAYSTKFRSENVTTAAIDNAAYLEAVAGADLAITMIVDQQKQSDLYQQGINISNTNYEPLRRSPPVIAIEAKMERRKGLEAEAPWAYAQVLHLHNISNLPYERIPALPLIIVQGSLWSFRYFEPRADEVVNWFDIALGRWTTLMGVYQIHAALQRLIAWAEHDYRPWFEENVIDRLHALDPVPPV